jgi:hypothetical protein
MYWLNYLDRNAIALAKLDNIEKDLKLSATRKFLKAYLLLFEAGH